MEQGSSVGGGGLPGERHLLWTESCTQAQGSRGKELGEVCLSLPLPGLRVDAYITYTTEANLTVLLQSLRLPPPSPSTCWQVYTHHSQAWDHEGGTPPAYVVLGSGARFLSSSIR